MAKQKTKSVLICPKCGGFDVKAYILEENATKPQYVINKKGLHSLINVPVPNPQKLIKVVCQNWPNMQTCGATAEYPGLTTLDEIKTQDPGIFLDIPNEYTVDLTWKILNLGSITINGTQHASLIAKCFDSIGHKYQFKGKSALEIVYKCKKDELFKGKIRIIKNLTSRYTKLSSFNKTAQTIIPNGARHDWSVKYYSQNPRLIEII